MPRLWEKIPLVKSPGEAADYLDISPLLHFDLVA